MISGYADFIAYFANLAEKNKAIKDFVVGGADRILMRENAIISYPVMWLTFPELAARPGGEDLRWQYNFQLWILNNAGVDDWAAENAALDSTLGIIEQVLRRMVKDAEEDNLFEFDPTTVVLQPKPKFAGDNDHGWVLEFDLTTHATICYDPENWIA